MHDYDYEIIESNGYLGHDNSLLDDDVLSFQPYFMEQKNPSAAAVELNTMRLMEDRPARFVVTEKATGKKVFDINLTDFLILTSMEGNKMKPQEYLDREDEYKIIFFFLTQLHGMLFRLTLMDGRGIFRMRKIKTESRMVYE